MGHTASVAVEKIIQEVLALPPEDRARVANALRDSLDPEEESLTEEEWEAAWGEELKRRLQEIDEGRAELIPAEEVFAALRARFPAR